jgi:branched-chain amino acid transport system substrate-binding protein
MTNLYIWEGRARKTTNSSQLRHSMRRLCRTTVFSATLVSLALAAIAPLNRAYAQSKDSIKVGVLMGFTGSAAFSAATNLESIRMGVKEINDSGGLLGRRVEIVQADDQFNPAQAVIEARRLTQQEKVHFVIGPQASTLALAVAPIFTESKTIYFSTTISPVPTPYNFSPVMSAVTMTQAMAQFVAETLKVKSVAFLSDNGAAAKSLLKDLQKQLSDRGIELKAIQEHETRGADITPQLLALRRANPELILHTASTGEDGGLLINNLREIGWNVRVVSAIFGLATGGTLKVAGPDAFKSGLYYSLLPASYTYCANEKLGDRAYDRYLAKLKAWNPEIYEKLDHKASLGPYDALMVFKAAVEGTKSLDGPALVSWIEKNGSTLRGAAGYPMAPSGASHFLIGASAMTFVTRPDVIRPQDKLVQRDYGC